MSQILTKRKDSSWIAMLLGNIVDALKDLMPLMQNLFTSFRDPGAPLDVRECERFTATGLVASLKNVHNSCPEVCDAYVAKLRDELSSDGDPDHLLVNCAAKCAAALLKSDNPGKRKLGAFLEKEVMREARKAFDTALGSDELAGLYADFDDTTGDANQAQAAKIARLRANVSDTLDELQQERDREVAYASERGVPVAPEKSVTLSLAKRMSKVKEDLSQLARNASPEKRIAVVGQVNKLGLMASAVGGGDVGTRYRLRLAEFERQKRERVEDERKKERTQDIAEMNKIRAVIDASHNSWAAKLAALPAPGHGADPNAEERAYFTGQRDSAQGYRNAVNAEIAALHAGANDIDATVVGTANHEANKYRLSKVKKLGKQFGSHDVSPMPRP